MRSTDGAGKHEAVACLLDADLLHHLANDYLDVLIVDINTLETVNLLNLGDDVVLNSLLTQNLEDIVRD